MDQILQVTPRGDADWRLQTMCLIIITIAAERFGVKEQHQFGGTAGPNRWEEKIRQLRQELRLLRKQFKQASEENRAALAELRNIRLWKIIKVIWRRGKVVQQWRHAEGVWIPKEENSSNIEQFRVIPLLSVEGKIFFSIVARRMTEFLLQNEYIDIAVQKGGIPKVPGCIEHTGVITQLIQEALEGGGDLAVLWLDLANAYESIPHKVVETSLTRHHVPEKISNLILNYYSCFKLRVTSGTVTSAFHRLEKGIITGCILFALAMNMIVKSAEVECRGPLSRSGVRQPTSIYG
ncbi:reverse transcriptase [Labeo rohita]|uniref:Reverse transcriptase n=1 Tax=Labeo rohita TaxID=84645 RepID=A0A498LQ16_LABRO|nr:reverse transcriptase [Labeo rohita]